MFNLVWSGVEQDARESGGNGVTPLGAMQKIVEHGVETDDGTCQFCWVFLQRGDPHEPDCLSLHYPKIVAALERLELMDKGMTKIRVAASWGLTDAAPSS